MRASDFDLVSADGAVSPAYKASPESDPSSTGVVILPDIRGAHAYYRGLARRFAQAGHSAVVLDYYGRHTPAIGRGAEFEWQPLFPALRNDDIDLDVAAATGRLRADGVSRVVSVGFCFGGAQSWRLGATDLGLAGAAGFYGPPRFVGEAADRIQVPILMLLAGDDIATTPTEFDDFEQRVAATGVDIERQDYLGAPHSFFDVAFDEWHDACADAWERLLTFVRRCDGAGE